MNARSSTGVNSFLAEVLRLAFDFDQDGSLPWDTILYSCIKKSGKTTINGALTLWWGFTQEAPNELLILANDLEQTLARVYHTMKGIIPHNPELQREAEVHTKTIYFANGDILQEHSAVVGIRRPTIPWESRRDSMLDIFGKAQPFILKPALQINRNDARLLVEALSGTWSYEQDRRDSRTVWHYVANAFTLRRSH